jgi:sulfhydrogenase subunit delta
MRPNLAVWKLASCDGCQLALLSAEDELLTIAGEIRIAHFLEASSAVLPGPYDISLVEGSITTAKDVERIHHIRAISRTLVTIGACATAGGIQALRNTADLAELQAVVYARPEYVSSLATSTAVADHVHVDLELRGCPIEVPQLVEVLSALLAGRPPVLPTTSVCIECKRRGTVCVTVADRIACLGPVTQAGCGARCPAVHRGCYGCFGPMEEPNTAALSERLRELDVDDPALVRLFRTFNADAPAFRDAAARHAAGAIGPEGET